MQWFFCMHAEEIYNVLKFHQVSSSLLLRVKNPPEFDFVFSGNCVKLKVPYVRIIKRKMHDSDFGGYLTHDNGHTTGRNLIKF